jgi:hypothetical protein
MSDTRHKRTWTRNDDRWSLTADIERWFIEFRGGATTEYSGTRGACFAVCRNNPEILSAVRVV